MPLASSLQTIYFWCTFHFFRSFKCHSGVWPNYFRGGGGGERESECVCVYVWRVCVCVCVCVCLCACVCVCVIHQKENGKHDKSWSALSERRGWHFSVPFQIGQLSRYWLAANRIPDTKFKWFIWHTLICFESHVVSNENIRVFINAKGRNFIHLTPVFDCLLSVVWVFFLSCFDAFFLFSGALQDCLLIWSLVLRNILSDAAGEMATMSFSKYTVLCAMQFL